MISVNEQKDKLEELLPENNFETIFDVLQHIGPIRAERYTNKDGLITRVGVSFKEDNTLYSTVLEGNLPSVIWKNGSYYPDSTSCLQAIFDAKLFADSLGPSLKTNTSK